MALTNCLACLCQTYLSPGDEAIYTEHGFLVYKIYIMAAGATPVVASENSERAEVDSILSVGHAAHKDNFPCQPKQSDRHIPAFRRSTPSA